MKRKESNLSYSDFPELSKTKASVYARLGSLKFRRKAGLFMAVGEKCVEDTRNAFYPESLLVTREWIEKNPDKIGHSEGQWKPELIRIASTSELGKLAGMNSSPEIIAIYNIPSESDETQKNETQDPSSSDFKPIISENELTLLLDGVQDPGNFGSIIRTADWFGFSRVFASRESADIYNPKVVQATMGAISRVKVIYTDLPTIIKSNPNLPVYGTLLDGKNIFRTQLSEKGMIVMGNEGRGLTPEVRKLVTDPLLIPPYNPISHGESLNVGAATAIVLATFRNKI